MSKFYGFYDISNPVTITYAAGSALTIAGATVGIHFTAAPTTTAIVVDASLVLPEFLKVGTFGGEILWDQADEFIEVHVETTTAAGSKPLIRYRLEGKVDAAHTGILITTQIQCYNQTTRNILNMKGLEVSTGFKGNATLSASGVWSAALLICEDLDNTVTCTGDMHILEIRANMIDAATAFNGESSFIFIRSQCDTNAVIDSVIMLSSTPGEAPIATYFLDFDSAEAPFVNGHTHDTEAKEIVCRVESTDYWLKLYVT